MFTKKTGISIAVFTLVFILLFGSLSFADRKKPKDIKESDWYYGAVESMIRKGIINGYDDNTFRPQNQVNRVEFSTMMVRTLKIPIVKSKWSSFDDVKSNYWGNVYIEAAKPYLTGYKLGEKILFKPLESAVREDMAVALVKGLKYNIDNPDYTVLDQFTDKNKISKNLKPYVAVAVEKKLMNGLLLSDGTLEFRPQKSLTRAEAAALLLKVIDEEKITFDEEKIILDDTSGTSSTTSSAISIDENISSNEDEDSIISKVPTVTVKVDEKKVKVKWSKVSKINLKGYKVVVSKYNSAPKYPNDGYLYWITDLDEREAEFDITKYYNGGDFGGKFEAGSKYFVSVTAYYEDEKVPGNAIEITMPNSTEDDDED
ncbi:S-layer homology domain-containing protein [Helicovermis profundi]|uniref:SLH domain-containing protein n=1 Tax=Helicovermis profundi TaxID=3065157 RepID=A0AAU9EN79_9FIRM|nr:hypothetical protein HLPR_19100 [Clostridia bacterium S502]